LLSVIKWLDLWTGDIIYIDFNKLPILSHNVLVAKVDVMLWVDIPPGG